MIDRQLKVCYDDGLIVRVIVVGVIIVFGDHQLMSTAQKIAEIEA